MATKRKTTTAIVAGVTAAALLLGGTFAWTSISQQAKNEAIVDINPGGRLHDDFNGTNKDVYVENFSSGATGVDIFARIRLDQYFEVGQDAGINKTGENRKVDKIFGDETDINDVDTWVTYKPGDTLSAPIQANNNWQWTLGNDDSNLPFYMPTFNKNKDSLKADINGTYEGITQGDIVHYDDYKAWADTDTDTQDATYDWDEDTDEDYNSETRNENDPIDSADVLKKEETHEATQISTTATVISMADWLALPDDQKTGNFWVYDTDGWAYWAQPIEPGKTTGLLLDGINMSKVPDDNYYYGINVVGQFATASDWEMLYSKTGEEKDAMTTGAKQLMELITNVASSEDEGNTTQTLVLTPANSHTVYAEIDEAINITYDITDYEGEVQPTPDISTVTVTYDEFDEENGGQAVPTPLTTGQYTYTYDPDTGMGTLTITDPNLDEYYLTVKDSTGEVLGDIDLSTPSNEPDITYDGTLTLNGANSDIEDVTVGVGITVELDASGIGAGDTQPDMSDVNVSYSVYDEGTGEVTDTVTLEKDKHYTYSYDETTGEGTLTIIDDTLVDKQLFVDDKNNVVLGEVVVSAITTLELTAEGTNSAEIDPGESVKVVSYDENADMSAIKVTYWTSFTEDGTPIFTELSADKFSYDAATGVLTILDESISDDYKVTDNSGNVSGYVSIYYETDATTLSISYAATGEYSEINQRGYIKPGESLMLVASASDGQHINSEDCTWTASCGEDHPCNFTDGELVIENLGNDVTPHLITVTCTYVNPETDETLYAEFHIMISDEDLIFTTTVEAEEGTTLTTGTAYTLSTTVSTATDGVIDLGNIEWGYSIVNQDGSWTGESTGAAESGDQFMAFKQGTYYVSAYYGEYFLSANTPSAITVTAGEEMSRYHVQVAGYDENDDVIWGNVTVGATDQEIDVFERIDDSTCSFDKIESTTDGITVTYNEEDNEWRITVAATVAPGEYTLTYTINADEEAGIAEQTGTIDLVIDAAA